MTADIAHRRLVAEPIIAYKTARLARLPDGSVGFGPMSADGIYRTSAVAQCRPVIGVTPGRRWIWGVDDQAVDEHDAPHPDCACGFYATVDRRSPTAGQVSLRVALTGTVIVHQRGYRAQRQQVMAVEIPQMCGCGATDVVGLSPCSPFRPVCRQCSDAHPVDPMSLSDLAGDLCVDVAWCEPATTPASITLTFQASTVQFQQAMTNAMQQLGQAAALTSQQFQTFFAVDPANLMIVDDDQEPEHPLDAKRRRDEERRQRLEQLAGPRRAPKTLR